MKSRRTREERQVIARRIFEALCEHYPDRHIALVERPGSIEPTPTADSAMAVDEPRPVSPDWGFLFEASQTCNYLVSICTA